MQIDAIEGDQQASADQLRREERSGAGGMAALVLDNDMSTPQCMGCRMPST